MDDPVPSALPTLTLPRKTHLVPSSDPLEASLEEAVSWCLHTGVWRAQRQDLAGAAPPACARGGRAQTAECARHRQPLPECIRTFVRVLTPRTARRSLLLTPRNAASFYRRRALRQCGLVGPVQS